MSEDVYTYRSIWISDTHLGTRNCQADLLLDFLRRNDSQYLYLVAVRLPETQGEERRQFHIHL